MKIGFAGNGHLMEHTFAAAKIKGFECEKYIPAATSFHPSDLSDCDIVYICPDRPSNIEPQAMVDLVLPYLDKDAVLVIHCQVEPGFTRQVNWPIEQLYYHVETLKVSENTMDRALNPERIIVGIDKENKCLITKQLREFFECFTNKIIVMSYEEAELAKIAINLYLAAQVCTTNTLVEVAEKIGAKWNYIIPALQTDKRIGKDAYLKPGYGLGKHLTRDLETIIKIGDNTDVMKTFLKHAEYRTKKAP